MQGMNGDLFLWDRSQTIALKILCIFWQSMFSQQKALY